jgi:hypothetical protein
MVNGWKGQVIYGKLSASPKDWICGILAPFFIFIDDNRSLYPHLEIDSEGRLRTKIYDKRDDFNFPIVNFPIICSNIPAAPAYGVYISWMIRNTRACGSYQDFLDRGLLLTKEATEPRVPFGKVEVITSKLLRSPQWLGWPLWNICVTNDHGYAPLVVNTSRVISSFTTYYRVCN